MSKNAVMVFSKDAVKACSHCTKNQIAFELV